MESDELHLRMNGAFQRGLSALIGFVQRSLRLAIRVVDRRPLQDPRARLPLRRLRNRAAPMDQELESESGLKATRLLAPSPLHPSTYKRSVSAV